MKRKDSRLLNECKDKLIAVVHTLNAGDPPDPTTFENFATRWCTPRHRPFVPLLLANSLSF